MSRLPRLRGKQIIRTLQKLGFSIIRQKGSHVFLSHPDGRSTVVPVHGGETIGPGLFHKILSDAEVEAEYFVKNI